MKAGKNAADVRMNMGETLSGLSQGKNAPAAGFVILLLIYAITSVFVFNTSRSDDAVMLMGQMVPLRSLTGAFSSTANLCLLLLAALYKKPGFIVSLVILLAQFPMLCFGVFAQHNSNIIPGFFSSILTILAIVLLYLNGVNISKYQARIREQAVTDMLTGIPNRYACFELMENLETSGEKFVLAVLNLNNFKSVNNTLGQSAADDLLVEIASRLKDVADQGHSGTLDFVARLGGDEFALIIRNYSSNDDIVNTLSCYEEALEKSVIIDGTDYRLTASIGYTECPTDASTGETALAYALLALGEAKRITSDSQALRFTQDLVDAEHVIEVEREIRTALESGRLHFELQPQYDMSRQLIGFEALARIRKEDGSILDPNTFIPVAEKVGLVDQIDYTILRDSTMLFSRLLQKTNANITLSANISVRYLMKSNFLDEVKEIYNTYGVPVSQLEIEITESIMIDSMEKALERISELKKMGLRIAIDDFGTGYSSLNYLNNFPADTLKIDKSFIDKMNTSDNAKQAVAAIVSLGHAMKLSVIAEGVEEPEQVETLRGIGCDYIQGFIWGRPMSIEEAEMLVAELAK